MTKINGHDPQFAGVAPLFSIPQPALVCCRHHLNNIDGALRQARIKRPAHHLTKDIDEDRTVEIEISRLSLYWHSEENKAGNLVRPGPRPDLQESGQRLRVSNEI